MKHVDIKLHFVENSATKVVIGQLCSIGNRMKYSAVSLTRNRFIDLLPTDFGIFLGHKIETFRSGLGPWEDETKIKEIAIFPRIKEAVVLDLGVLESACYDSLHQTVLQE